MYLVCIPCGYAYDINALYILNGWHILGFQLGCEAGEVGEGCGVIEGGISAAAEASEAGGGGGSS